MDDRYRAMDPEISYSNSYPAQVLTVGGVAYIPNGVGLVEAFNPGTGETIWVQDPRDGVEDLRGASTRGVAYWSDGSDERILVQRGTYLYALNARTGETYPELRAEAIEITKRYVTGPRFTPPSIRGDGPDETQGTIQLPGSQGGPDVQGAAFDPETGYLYVPSVTAPFVADIREVQPRPGESAVREGNPTVDRRAAWAAAVQAAVRADHGDRHEQGRACLEGRACLDGAERRWPA